MHYGAWRSLNRNQAGSSSIRDHPRGGWDCGRGSWGSLAWGAKRGRTRGGSRTPPRGPPTSISGSAPSAPTALRGPPRICPPRRGTGRLPRGAVPRRPVSPAGRRGRRGLAPHLSASPGGPGASAAGPSARSPVSAVALIPGAPLDKSPGRLRASARGEAAEPGVPGGWRWASDAEEPGPRGRPRRPR